MKAFTRDTAGRKLEKRDFFLVFNQAWDHGITVENAQGGFRGSGLVPWNPKALPPHAYTPSRTTERDLSAASAINQSAVLQTNGVTVQQMGVYVML